MTQETDDRDVPLITALGAKIEQLRAEVERLRALLRRHHLRGVRWDDIDDCSWLSVTLNDAGDPEMVSEHRVLWAPGREPDNKFMTERVKRAIAQARHTAAMDDPKP
jgi:hypothetical protein